MHSLAGSHCKFPNEPSRPCGLLRNIGVCPSPSRVQTQAVKSKEAIATRQEDSEKRQYDMNAAVNSTVQTDEQDARKSKRRCYRLTSLAPHKREGELLI